MKFLNLFLGLCLASQLIIAQSEKMKPVFETSNWEKFKDSAKTEKKIILIQCGADWCLPCKQMEKYSFTDAAFLKYAAKNLFCFHLDAANFDDINAINQFKIDKYPTTIFLNASGKEIKRLVGFQSAKNLIAETEKIIHPKKILLPPPTRKLPEKAIKK